LVADEGVGPLGRRLEAIAASERDGFARSCGLRNVLTRHGGAAAIGARAYHEGRPTFASVVLDRIPIPIETGGKANGRRADMAEDPRTSDQRNSTPKSAAAAGNAPAPGPGGGAAADKPSPAEAAGAKGDAQSENKGVTEYTVTIDNRTGLPVAIQKVDEATGEKRDLTAGDYATLCYGGSAASLSAPAGTAAATDPHTLAYYQGAADAAKAATASSGGSFDATGGFSDAYGGYSDAYGGYADPLGGYTDSYGGYSDAAGGYSDPYGGYSDPYGGYSDAAGGYYDAAGGYSDPYGGYADAYGGYTDAYGGYSDPYGGYTDALGNYYSPV
jgi:hypothetical protein